MNDLDLSRNIINFKANFLYGSFFKECKHSLFAKFGIYKSTLTKNINIEVVQLGRALDKANDPTAFFDAIIESIANVYVLKQQNGAKKNDFEASMKKALEACKGENKYFNAAITEIIKRIDRLPNDFYKDKNHSLMPDFKEAVKDFFTIGRMPQSYLDTVLGTQQEEKTTAFYAIRKASGFQRDQELRNKLSISANNHSVYVISGEYACHTLDEVIQKMDFKILAEAPVVNY